MGFFAPPKDIAARPFARLPDKYRRPQTSAWGSANRPHHQTDSFLEGPCFDADGRLYVVDIPFGRVFRIDEGGEWTLVIEYDGWPNGLKFDDANRLLIADHKNGLMRLDVKTATVEPVLERAGAEPFKGLNDLVFGPQGELYFTDQGQTGMHDPTGRVFRFAAGGALTDLLGTGPSPNGVAVSPSGDALFVAMTRAQQIWRIPLNPNGLISKVGVFAMLPGGPVGPDGIAFDEEGNLYVAHPGTGCVWAFSPKGAPFACVRTDAGMMTTNIAFGGPGRKQLFITESQTGVVLVADMPIAGMVLHQGSAEWGTRAS